MNSHTPRTTFTHGAAAEAVVPRAISATTKMAAPMIQAFQAVAASEVVPSTQGETNSQIPTSTFSQLCQRVQALMEAPPFSATLISQHDIRSHAPILPLQSGLLETPMAR